MVKQSIEVMSTLDAIALVKKFVKEVRDIGIELKKVYVFGSYARNHQTDWSDIDVALVADQFTGFRYMDKMPIRSINSRPEYQIIEVHTFPTEDLIELNNFLGEVVIRTGIEIELL